MNRGKTRPALLGIVLALALTGTGRADYLESFRAGFRAVEFKQWPEAVWSMREAIAQKPQNPGENVRVYGTILVPYIPHYFLGLGLYRQGDFAGAMTAFEEAEAKGMARGLYRSRLRLYHGLCVKRLSLPPRQIAQQPPRPSPGTGGGPRPGGVSQSAPPVQTRPGPRPAPDPGTGATPATSTEVRKQTLQKAVREGQEWLARGDKIVGSLAQKRQRDPRRFERDPNRIQDLKFAEEKLQAARFQLEACRREGDVDGAEEARNDAQAAWEMLDELSKDL